MNTNAIRQKILELAMHGKLTQQLSSDQPAKEMLLKENKAFIESKGEWIVPENWCWAKVDEVFYHNTGKALNKSANNNGVLLPYLTTSNVYWNRFELCNIRKMYFKESEIEKCTISKGDLLVCEGGDIGRAAIWDSEDTICIQNHLHRLRSKANLANHKFYLYIFWLYKQVGLIQGNGIGLLGLSSKALGNIEVPLPPLSEQERIVAEIEKLFAELDTIEQNRKALQLTLKALRQQILSRALRGELVEQKNDEGEAKEEMPEGWSIVNMKDLCSLSDGEKHVGKMLNLDVKYLRGEREAKTLQFGKLVLKDTLMILVDGENSGEVFRAPHDGYQGSTFKQLTIKEGICEKYILQVINNNRKMLKENKIGSAIPHLNKKIFYEIEVPLPPLFEQERIVAEIEKLFAELDEIEKQMGV